MADQTHGSSEKTQAQRPLQQQPAEPQGPQVELESPAAALQRGRIAPPDSLSPQDVIALQRTVGNQGVQTILSQRTPAAERFGVWQPRSEPPTKAGEEEEEEIPQASPPMSEQIGVWQPRSEPPTQVGGEEEEIPQASPQISVAQRLGAFPEASVRPEHAAVDGRAPLVPVDPSRAGACVICQSKKFAIWVNPAEPACTRNCIRAHEQKHIDDFTADANYKNKCASITDGETFYYASSADAKRFEHPAIDLEINCIRKQLENTTNATDKAILERRMNTTLPAYKASFTG